MTRKKNFVRSAFVVGVIAIVALSCKKEAKNAGDTQAQESTGTAVSASVTAYSILNSAFDIMFATGIPNAESGRSISASERKYGCATVTATPAGLVVFPKTVWVDFGTGCTLRGYNGKGSVSFSLPQWIFIPGTEIVPTFHDFFVNGYKIEGDYKITTISAKEFKVDIIDGLVTFPDKTVYHLKGTQYYTHTKGTDTPLVFGDDAYSITGDIMTSSKLGDINGEITSPLIKEVDCYNITQGTIAFTDVNNTTALLDFGDGTCDNKGTLKIGSFSLPITLPF